jgi:hypothetical protein
MDNRFFVLLYDCILCIPYSFSHARIVDPVSEPVPITEESHGSRHVDEYLIEDLESLDEGEDRYVSTIARALLYIISRWKSSFLS